MLIVMIQKYPFLSCFLLGALGALSFAPFNNLLAISLSILGFLWIFERHASTLKKAFFLFLTYFYSYYFFNLYWVSLSFISLGQWWLTPIAMLCFPLIFCGMTFWVGPVLKYFIGNRFYPLAFAILFFSGEWIVGRIFPWVLVAYTWGDWGMQLGAYIGTYGLSFLTLILIVLLYKALKMQQGLVFICVCAISLFGFNRLKTPVEYLDTVVRIVHPCIAQKDKHDRNKIIDNFNCHRHLSLAASDKPLNMVVWPEASIPLIPNDEWLYELQSTAPENGYTVIGAPRIGFKDDLYTSAYVLNRDSVVDIYDKMHLVPFGEYLPFKNILSHFGAQKITKGARDYTPGLKRPLYNLKNIPPFSILICFEIIFPGEVLNTTDQGKPEWLLNITNDAWYLHTTGPYQHLHIVRFRAVEEGIPIIRCANKGVSALIDGLGRIQSSLGLKEKGYLDVRMVKITHP